MSYVSSSTSVSIPLRKQCVIAFLIDFHRKLNCRSAAQNPDVGATGLLEASW